MSNIARAAHRERISRPHGSGIMEQRVLLGGYSSEVPPLPIPNREVKLTNADGTAYLGGRVGSRLFKPSWIIPTRLFCVCMSWFAPFLFVYSTIPFAQD